MQRVSNEIYARINNSIYDLEGDRWWQADFSLNLIRTLFNPLRVNYTRKIFEQLKINPEGMTALEVGCGGGILSEDLAQLGFSLSGIDPSVQSLNMAIEHAKISGLDIKYMLGSGENLQFQDNSFDVVFCCDVLEHVRDLPKVIAEISRVLNKGGIFVYDTFNRTLFSKIVVIKILQEWNHWAIMPPGLHVWEMFVKPREIKLLLQENQLEWIEHCGIQPNISYLKMLHLLRSRAAGKMTYEKFGQQFMMIGSNSTQIMYMGYALKR